MSSDTKEQIKPVKIERPEPWVREDGTVDPEYNAKHGDEKTAESNDLDIFLPDPRTFTDLQGNEFQTRKIGWGSESKIAFKFGKIIVKIMKATAGMGPVKDLQDIDFTMLSMDEIIEQAMTEAPDLVTDAAVALTGKERKWVDENLDLETVLEIVVPFFKRRWTKWSSLLQRFVPNLQGAAEKAG